MRVVARRVATWPRPSRIEDLLPAAAAWSTRARVQFCKFCETISARAAPRRRAPSPEPPRAGPVHERLDLPRQRGRLAAPAPPPRRGAEADYRRSAARPSFGGPGRPRAAAAQRVPSGAAAPGGDPAASFPPRPRWASRIPANSRAGRLPRPPRRHREERRRWPRATPSATSSTSVAPGKRRGPEDRTCRPGMCESCGTTES